MALIKLPEFIPIDMKNTTILVLLVLILKYSSSYSQNPIKEYVLDPQGNIGDFQYLIKKYSDKVMAFRMTKDSGKVYQINAPQYYTQKINYKKIKIEISRITNTIYNDSTTFIIGFYYKNDTTLLSENNVYNENSNYKAFVKELKRKIEKKIPNTIVFELFENGISFSGFNKKPKKRELFYSDNNNFFKENIFKKSIPCGSECIIKPNGEVLVRNGEYRLDEMAKNIKVETWLNYFKNEN